MSDKRINTKLMSLAECLNLIVKGMRIRRYSWPAGYYVYLFGGIVKIYDPTKKQSFDLILSGLDILADDWMAVVGKNGDE